MDHVPDNYDHWVRQKTLAQNAIIDPDRVYQISKMSPGQARPLVVASCGKTSAQRFLAAVAQQENGQDRYRVTAVFINPSIPGLEAPGVER
jgi:hypothetical protein